MSPVKESIKATFSSSSNKEYLQGFNIIWTMGRVRLRLRSRGVSKPLKLPFDYVDWQSLSLAGRKDLGMTWDGSSAKLLQTLSLHSSDINGVAFGRHFTLATGSSDKKVQICTWEKDSGFSPLPFCPLQDHKYGITCVNFSPFGTILATCSVDGSTILWDVTTGDKLTSFIAPGNAAVRICKFSPNSALLFTAGDDGAVNIFNVSTSSLQKTLLAHEEAVYAGSFLPDDNYLVSGCSAGLLYLWSINQDKPVAAKDNAHDLGITSLEFSKLLIDCDGSLGKLCLMVTGGHDHNVKMWNVKLGLEFSIQLVRTIAGHSASVMCVALSDAVGLIASTSGDKTLRIWNLSGTCMKVLEGHSRYVTSCKFSHDGKLVASGSNDKSCIIWDLSGTLSINEEIRGDEYSISTGEVWYQYEKLCRSRMLQEGNGVSLTATFQVPKVDFNSCTFIGPSVVVAAASSSKCVFAWDLTTSEEIDIASICSHKYAVNCVAYSSQLDLVASASTDGTVNLFNTTGKKGGIFHPSGGALRVVCFSPDSSMLLAAGDDEKASLWIMESVSLMKQFEEHEAAIYAAAFSPDSRYAVTGCVNGLLKLWDCLGEDFTPSIATQEGHELGVSCCDFSPKGMGGTHGQHRFLLATGGNDSLIKIWEVTVGADSAGMSLWQTFTDHGTANVMCVRFSPSGKLLASTAGDKTVRMYDMGLGCCVHVIEAHDRYVTSCAFATSTDGSFLASCSGDHKVLVHKLHGSLACETAAVENMAVEVMISKWTCEDVVNWLAEIGLGDLGHVFESNEVQGEKLVNINDTTLSADLGIEDETVRKQVLTELQWLKSLGMSSVKNRASKGGSVTIAAPVEFFCPITHDIMVEPVSTSDGHTYERSAITEWFLTGKTTSPLTNIELDSMNLTPNFDLQNQISEFLAQRLRS